MATRHDLHGNTHTISNNISVDVLLTAIRLSVNDYLYSILHLCVEGVLAGNGLITFAILIYIPDTIPVTLSILILFNTGVVDSIVVDTLPILHVIFNGYSDGFIVY